MAPSRGSPRQASMLGVFFFVLLLLALGGDAASSQECPVRHCLPPDATQSPPLCYTETLAPFTQSFSKCPADRPHCNFCVEEPPCESVCRAQTLALKPAGAECFYDEECSGQFSKCLQRVCRRALHTFQKCSPDDPNDVCILGKKSCFKGRCQGLQSGELCRAQPEGRDIDCNPGWYCFLGVCAPQLPASHTCEGLRANECVRGYRCNTAILVPKCIRQFTLDLGMASSEASLCKSNHVHPSELVCSLEPEILYRLGNPVISGIDCSEDSECPRSDGSLGRCACKRWWNGEGSPGYCELFIQDSSRPHFKRFWENSIRLCHPDWSQERCAAETSLQGELALIKGETLTKSSDPAAVPLCASDLLADEILSARGSRTAASPGWLAASIAALSLQVVA